MNTHSLRLITANRFDAEDTHGIAFSLTSIFRWCAEAPIVGDSDDELVQEVPLLSKAALRLPAPLTPCSDVDIADGTWFDVDG